MSDDLEAARARRAQQQEDDQPHLSGGARCLQCGHTWVAVAPTGTTYLVCPECKTEKGVFDGPCEREEPHWSCNCCCQMFLIVEKGIYCPLCGSWQYPS